MLVTCDLRKRDRTLKERGLDLLRATEVFSGLHLTREDDRFNYDEKRYVTVGWLDERLVIFVWTPRGLSRRIISMRHCHEREAKKILSHLFEKARQ